MILNCSHATADTNMRAWTFLLRAVYCTLSPPKIHMRDLTTTTTTTIGPQYIFGHKSNDEAAAASPLKKYHTPPLDIPLVGDS